MMNHAQLLAEFVYPTKNPDITAALFDYYVNLTLPSFLRNLVTLGLHNNHSTFIPRLRVTLAQTAWEYDWLATSKYSATVDAASGVIAITAPQSTYFISPGDTANYNGTNYQIVSVSTTGITLDTSVTDTAKALLVYADPLCLTDAYVLKSGRTAGQDEEAATIRSSMSAPGDNGWISKLNRRLTVRQRGGKLEVTGNYATGDVLNLFYIPKPLKFVNTNTFITGLTNPTQISDEANRALLWATGKRYWMQRQEDVQAKACNAMASEILGLAASGKGAVIW